MPANRKPKAWNLKPHLTAAPELWRDALSVAAVWNSAGPDRDLVTKSDASEGAGVSKNFGLLGLGVNLRNGINNNYVDYFTGRNLSSSDDLTLAALFRCDNLSGAVNDFSRACCLDDGSDGFTLDIDRSGNVFTATFGGNTLGNTTKKVDDGGHHAAVIVWRHSAGDIRVFVDGKLEYTVTGYGDTSPINDARFIIGANILGTRAQAINGQVFLGVGSARAWSNNEAVAFSRDPFAMLRPAGF